MNKIALFKENQIIFCEGDISRDVFLIKEGQVKIFQMIKSKEVEITTLGPGDIFGEMSFIDNSPRSATAQAVTDTKIHVIREESLDKVLDQNPIWFNALVRVLIGRLRETTAVHNIDASIHPLKHLNKYVQNKIDLGHSINDVSADFSKYLDDIEYRKLKNILHQSMHKV